MSKNHSSKKKPRLCLLLLLAGLPLLPPPFGLAFDEGVIAARAGRAAWGAAGSVALVLTLALVHCLPVLILVRCLLMLGCKLLNCIR